MKIKGENEKVVKYLQQRKNKVCGGGGSTELCAMKMPIENVSST